jgi:hypothetical protein
MILLERIFDNKKITIALLEGFDFFGRLIVHFPSQWTIYFLFKKNCNNKMVCIHVFF